MCLALLLLPLHRFCSGVIVIRESLSLSLSLSLSSLGFISYPLPETFLILCCVRRIYVTSSDLLQSLGKRAYWNRNYLSPWGYCDS